MAGDGSPGSFCPLPPTIVRFLIQVKPPTSAKSNDGVSLFSRRSRVFDPQLLRCSMPRDTQVEGRESWVFQIQTGF
jgi:hypothetical protein